jgi:hypothetical protein
MDGYKTLKAGQDVEFDIERGAKGMHAVNIRSMETDGRATTAVGAEDGVRSDESSVESPPRNEYAESR